MKWFYIIAILVAGGMVVLPLTYLKAEKEGQFDGLVIGYGEDGRPIRKDKAVVYYDGYGAAIRSIDPITCGDTSSAGIQSNFYEGLYSYHYLKRPVYENLVCVLAAEFPKVSDDHLTYTIRIRPDVKYQRNPCFGTEADGRHKTRTVRARDFVLAFKRCADFHVNAQLSWALISGRIKGLDAYRDKTEKDFKRLDFLRYDLDVEGVRALDDQTLQIKLTEPYPQLKYVLAMALYAPIPREAVDYWMPRTGLTEFHKPESVVGTGPYLLHTFKPKNKIILVRNPDFRPDFYPAEGEAGDEEMELLADAGKRVPFIDVAVFDWMPQDYSAWMMFLSKRKDASGIPERTFEFVITPDKELTRKWRQRHIYLRKAWSPSVYWIVFNMEDPILGRSKALRQAICLAYDVESHIKVLYNDRGKRAVNIIPSTFPGHKEAGAGPYYRLDLAAAREKIEEAKNELGPAMLLDEYGEIPELTLDMSQYDRADKFGEFVKQQFRKIGLRLKVIYNDWPTLQKKVDNKQSQIYTMGWHADYPDAENFFQLFYSPNIDKGTNNSNYKNEEFDRLYERIRTMDETPERMALYVRMSSIINEDCPVLLLSEPQSFVMYYDWMSNVKLHPIGYGYLKYRRIDYDLRKKLGGRN